MLLRTLTLVLCLFVAVPASDAAEQSLGQTLKKIFSSPTPTPRRKKKTTAATATKKKSPTPTPSPTPSATASPEKKRIPAATEETPSPSPKKRKGSPTPTPTSSPRHKKKTSPTPQPFETSETPSPTTTPTPEQPPTPSPNPKKLHAPNATLMPNQIKGFENYPLKVQKLLTAALELTTRDLDYKYGSADPTSGGMDCSAGRGGRRAVCVARDSWLSGPVQSCYKLFKSNSSLRE